MHQSPVQPWIDRLRAVLGPDPLDGVDPDTFADENGNRRTIDRPLLAWLLHFTTAPTRDMGLDLVLWHALANDTSFDGAIMVAEGSLQDAAAPSRGEVAIEVWTERELAAIQALWTIGVQRIEPLLTRRAEGAAQWCVQELQPDNATAHPWAVNAFASLAAQGDIEADLYAQTLMHNAQVGTGRPGRFASVVILASLRSLELI
ncbi:MAG: hypothetical protein NCW75_02655 [Phycisphaera sp.]|nr:MAG: hypothetical protein NCW75_02655 [Phycisphaera sp.]